MKILFVINTLGQAGAEMALLELLRYFSGKNKGTSEYEVSLYVMLGQGELVAQLPQNVKLLNSHYHAQPVLTKKGRMLMIRTMVSSFFKNGRIMHKLWLLCSGLVEMGKNRRVSMDKLCWRILSEGAVQLTDTYDLAVAFLEGASTYFVADHVKAKKKAAFVHIDYAGAGYTRGLDRGCYQAFDRIFAVSDEVKGQFEAMYPEHRHKMRVLHNLVNQERIRMLANGPGGFSDGFGGFRILTVGRLVYQKAYDVALLALKELIHSGFKVRWYVLGEGPMRAALERQIENLRLTEDFVLMGAVENPYPYYKQCSLYVHATRFEGKSIAIQEAQTLGCAILASDCNGNREQITDNVDGRFCQLTPEGIASGIRQLLEDEALRKRLGQAAARRTVGNEAELGRLLELLSH